MKTIKRNGEPSLYGLACGYGLTAWNTEKTNRKSLFEDESHNVIDVRAAGVWEQFFYHEYPRRSDCYAAAVKFYKSILI
jgi:hypothetical protein